MSGVPYHVVSEENKFAALPCEVLDLFDLDDLGNMDKYTLVPSAYEALGANL